MRDAMNDMFDALLTGEPPLGLTTTQVRDRGRRRLHRRRTLVAGGYTAGVIVAAGAVVTYGLPGGGVLTGLAADPSASASATPTPSPNASPTASTSPVPTVSPGPSRTDPATVFEIPHCDGDGTPKLLNDTDGSVLPDVTAASQAVLAQAATIAPGRTFTLVLANREDTSAKHPGAPREYIIFDVSDAAGTGSVNLELIPQAGMSAADRATIDERAKPFSNCTPAIRVDFPDGAAGLKYPVASGTGAPDSSDQHTYYYGAGFDINGATFLTPTSDPTGAHGARKSMPLTTDEVLAICRIVALSR